MKPINCPYCGAAAAIRSEREYRGMYAIRAVCTGCGRRGKKTLDTKHPPGAAATYWATMNWNIGIYEQEGRA